MTHFGLMAWGSEGDVQPFLGLSAHLAERGHEVTLMVSTNADAHYDAPDGVTLERVGPPIHREQGADMIARAMAMSNPVHQARLVHDEGLAPLVEELYAASQRLAHRADVIVRHHFLHMTQAAAMSSGTPEVSVFFTPDLLPTRRRPPTGMPSLGPLQSAAWGMMARVVGGVFLPGANALRMQHGLPRARNLLTEVWASPTANLIAVSPTLSPRPDDWPEHHHMTGSWSAPLATHGALDTELDEFLDAGAPPVFVTFGSMMPADEGRHEETVELLVRAVRGAGRRLIMQTPRAREIDAGEDVFAVGTCPHRVVCSRCALVVHHGGAGTTQTALRAGVPSVIVPHLADQFFWASRVAKLGAGLEAPGRAKVTAARLQKSITRAMDDASLAERARRLGAELDAQEGLSRAAEVLEAIEH